MPSTMEVLEFRLNATPVVVIPALDGLELLVPVVIDLVEAHLAQTFAFNGAAFDERSQSGRFLGAVHSDGFVVLETERFQISDMRPEIVRGNEQEIAFFEAEFGIADFPL